MWALQQKTKRKCRNRPFCVPATQPSWTQSGDGSCSFSFPLNPTLSWISSSAFLCQSASLGWIAMWIFPAGNPALSTLTWHTYAVSWLPKTPAHLFEWHCAHFPSSLAIFRKALLPNDDWFSWAADIALLPALLLASPSFLIA